MDQTTEQIRLLTIKIPHLVIEIQQLFNDKVSEEVSLLEELSNTLQSIDIQDNNYHLLSIVFQSLDYYIDYAFTNCERYQEKNKQKNKVQIFIVCQKMRFFTMFIKGCKFMPQDDLFCQAIDDERWQNLRHSVNQISLGVPDQVNYSFKKFSEKVCIGQAFVSQSYKKDNPSSLRIGFNAAKYGLQPKKSQMIAKKFQSNPNKEASIYLWNILESSMMTMYIRAHSKSVEVNQVIYLPRVAPHIFDPVQNVMIRRAPFFNEETQNTIPTRVISIKKLPCLDAQTSKSFLFCCGQEGRNIQLKEYTYDKLIFHVHGGGFVAMSSASHQEYLRNWANKLNAPILSVDYRLSPQYKYPCALDDVWQAYIWVINNAQKKLGIDPKKIILVGDSAGANLVMGVVQRAIELSYRKPDSILLIYPCLVIDLNHFSPSYLMALEDPILSAGFLKVCIDSYLSEDTLQSSYLSPLRISDEVLSQFPRLELVGCSRDPMVDDSYRFLERLQRLGIQSTLAIFEGAMHGSLNFVQEVKECQQIADYCNDLLEELIS